MPRKKKTKEVVVQETWPKVIQGSHSTRIEYEDGRVDFTTDWDALKRDVQNALTEYENSVNINNVKSLKTKKVKK